MTMIKLFVTTLSFILMSACAQVPRESVELSATVGRDMVEMERAHLAIVNLYYDRIVNEINVFIDDVYLPYQVQNTLADAVILTEMRSAIENASQPDPTGRKQKEGVATLSIFLEEIYREVESYRHAKLAPVQKQRADLVVNIEASYGRIHYANSIVTGHLASVVKVHDTQNEILAKVDLEDLRTKVGIKAVDLSDGISALIDEGKKKQGKIDKVIDKFNQLIEKIDK